MKTPILLFGMILQLISAVLGEFFIIASSLYLAIEITKFGINLKFGE